MFVVVLQHVAVVCSAVSCHGQERDGRGVWFTYTAHCMMAVVVVDDDNIIILFSAC